MILSETENTVESRRSAVTKREHAGIANDDVTRRNKVFLLNSGGCR